MSDSHDDLRDRMKQWPGERFVVSEGMDHLAALDMRNWVQQALEAKGAKITGGGVSFSPSTGRGDCDLDIELDSCWYNITVRLIG